MSLTGWGFGDRDRGSALETAELRCAGRTVSATRPASGNMGKLLTPTAGPAAELSTIGLRWRLGHSARLWITSGTVSGVGGDVPPPKTDRAPEYDQKTRQRAGPLQDAAETRQTEWRPAVHAPSLNHNDAKKRTDGAT